MPSHVDFIVHRFLMGFGSQFRPPEPQKSSPRCSESTIFQKNAFRNLHRFFIDFGANKPPFSLQKSTNIASKFDLGRHQFFDRFLHRFYIDFCSIWEANLAPCWQRFRLKWGSAVACSPLFCWFYVIFRLFGRPGPLLAPFWLDFGRFGAPFWRFLASIFLYFGKIWGTFVRTILASFSKHFKLNSGWGWAGGVTRSAKNFDFLCLGFFLMEICFFSDFSFFFTPGGPGAPLGVPRDPGDRSQTNENHKESMKMM